MKQTISLLVFAVLLAPVAFADFSFQPQTTTLSIEKGLEASIQLLFHNDSNASTDISVRAESTNPGLQVFLQEDGFTLHEGERTSVSLVIKPLLGIADGAYFVTVTARDYNETIISTIEVKVFSQSDFGFSFSENDFEVCQGSGWKTINVSVGNNGAQRDFLLYTDSDEFAPEFAPEELEIGPGAGRDSSLRFYVNQTHSIGMHSIPVIVSDRIGKMSEKALVFEVKNCAERDGGGDGEDENDFFDLSISPSSIVLGAGKEETVTVRLRNLLDEEQKVFLSSESIFEMDKLPYEVFLSSGEEKTFEVVFTGRQQDPPGEHEAAFFAWNEKATDEETLEVEVPSESRAELTVLNNDITQRICSAVDLEVFEVEIKNTGDEEQKFFLSIENDHDTIGVTINDREVLVFPGEKRLVRIVVQPAFDTPLGEKEVILVARDEEWRIVGEEKLSFTVVAPFGQDFGTLRIESAPVQVSAVAGETTPFSVVVRNTGTATLENVTVRLFGSDNSFSVAPLNIGSLGPGEAKSAELVLVVKESAQGRNYDLTIEARSGVSVGVHPFRLEIRPKSPALKERQEGLVAGFAGLFSAPGGALFFAVALLIILLAIILMFSLQSGNNFRRRPVWA
ncbi:MAG: hypothetical protein HY392_05570 [Candidatus Diapherotrites archaeon]|nr:hypothetical protein [Candidatus Diapherotrites archaeon]